MSLPSPSVFDQRSQRAQPNSRSAQPDAEPSLSGMRVIKAADDAAGSAVAMNLSTQARSGKQAIRNANDGISVIQTAESATKEVLNILDRMRELAVQSSSETLEDGERAYIDEEFHQLSDEVERIAQSSEFNDLALSDGSTSQLAVQVGVDASSNSRVTIGSTDHVEPLGSDHGYRSDGGFKRSGLDHQ